jgi:F-type H+-transporting ATPase subunit epsilon
MRLTLITPGQVLVDEPAVAAIRAEDASGHFGILPQHADFLTSLTVSVLTWRSEAGKTSFAAVRGGLLTVEHGEVRVATPEAVLADSLDSLEADILARLTRNEAAEQRAHQVVRRCELQVLAELAREIRHGGQQP